MHPLIPAASWKKITSALVAIVMMTVQVAIFGLAPENASHDIAVLITGLLFTAIPVVIFIVTQGKVDIKKIQAALDATPLGKLDDMLIALVEKKIEAAIKPVLEKLPSVELPPTSIGLQAVDGKPAIGVTLGGSPDPT